MKTELGGDRLGSGNKQEISMKNYERSTHDIGYVWRSSMSCGTLVPFMTEIGLPGDSFDIGLNCSVLTLPTIGPLFGSYKVQLDIFQCPLRLYQGKLHMNMLNIGLSMADIKLPLVEMVSDYEQSGDSNHQISPSSIWSYLGIRGLGRTSDGLDGEVQRKFNAVPYLGYWEIYKNYYANKQENAPVGGSARGYVIHSGNQATTFEIDAATVLTEGNPPAIDILDTVQGIQVGVQIITLHVSGVLEGEPDYSQLTMEIAGKEKPLDQWYQDLGYNQVSRIISGRRFVPGVGADENQLFPTQNVTIDTGGPIKIEEFDLDNIDTMRSDILADVGSSVAYEINAASNAPYGLSLKELDDGAALYWTKAKGQEGLAIKTYQSDLFNNWISTEWIDGTNGINDITAVSTVGDEFTIDALNLANKVYTMLNRIAISGGSYDDWLDAVYTHERAKSTESPIYHGSLIKELSFEEVVNVSASEGEPLGTLAGRGKLTSKNKGGTVKINISEPSYIIGICSITPRIDYSQGNKWDVGLRTMDDYHKPALDEIGYQDLITDQMAWFDTVCSIADVQTYSSAGKQPAWINYMTNINQIKGNFAIESKEMFMVLDRRYEKGATTTGIDDLTTYIDPTKYNQIFAETNLDAQNFWVQIGIDNTARRKMSAKVIPNL